VEKKVQIDKGRGAEVSFETNVKISKNNLSR